MPKPPWACGRTTARAWATAATASQTTSICLENGGLSHQTRKYCHVESTLVRVERSLALRFKTLVPPGRVWPELWGMKHGRTPCLLVRTIRRHPHTGSPGARISGQSRSRSDEYAKQQAEDGGVLRESTHQLNAGRGRESFKRYAISLQNEDLGAPSKTWEVGPGEEEPPPRRAIRPTEMKRAGWDFC